MSQWIRPSERGNFMVPAAIVLVVVGVLALGYFVVMDNAEPREDEAGAEVDKPFDVRWATVAELEERDGLELTAWEGVLTCHSLTDRDPFKRDVNVLVSEEGLFWERGAAVAFAEQAQGSMARPREFPDTFEWWRGTLADNEVEVEGWYREGTDRVKPLSLSGEAYEGYMYLEGERGPRECTYEAVREGSGQSLDDEWGA